MLGVIIFVYVFIGIIFFGYIHSTETKTYNRYNEWYHLRLFNKNWKDLAGAIIWPISLLYVLIGAFIYWIQE